MSEKIGEAWHNSREPDVYDVGFTLAISPVAVPTMLMGAGAVAAFDRVNPVFMQRRIGLGGPIEVPKLTTLGEVYNEVPRHGGYDDPRATAVGSLLRRTHIDELPQTLLLLNRKMSLVGPRAVTLVHEEQIRSKLNALELERRDYTRSACLPGLAMNYSMHQHFGEGDIDPSLRAWVDYDWAMNGSRRKYFEILRNNVLAVGADLAGMDVMERPGHPQTVAGLEHIATHFGVQVDDEDRQYWRSMLTVSRALDIHVDEDGNQNVRELMSHLLAGESIPHMTSEECEEFKRVFWAQPAEKQDTILLGTCIGELAAELRQARSVKQIINTRMVEAEIFADILALPVQSVHNDTERRSAFNEWLQHFSRAGFMLDTLIDQSADYALGTTAVKPSIATTFALSKEVFKGLRQCYRDVPERAIPSIAVAGVAKFIRGTIGQHT